MIVHAQMEDTVKVLLMFGTQKKIVTLPQIENFDEFLISKAEDFCTSPFVIQYFDEDFDEWCNIDGNYQPTHKQKLQVVQIGND